MRPIPLEDRTKNVTSKQVEKVSCSNLPFLRIAFSLVILTGLLTLWANRAQSIQIETIDSIGTRPLWVSMVRLEGHLDPTSSVQNAFSPDGSALVVTGIGSVVLFDLKKQEIKRVLKPQVEDVTDLNVLSANFLDDFSIFIRARGKMRGDDEESTLETPELIFRWSIMQDSLEGTVKAMAQGKQFGSSIYFPRMSYLVRYSGRGFDLWSVKENRVGKLKVEALTRRPDVFTISPDGRLLLATRFAGSSQSDIVVIRLKDQQMITALKGHKAVPLCISYSSDGSRIATAGQDQTVRIWKTSDWSTQQVLEGHTGTINWVEFSPDGSQIVSGGDDKSIRIWSSNKGDLLQTISDNKGPVRIVAFSPDGKYLVSSSEHDVHVYRQVIVDR